MKNLVLDGIFFIPHHQKSFSLLILKKYKPLYLKVGKWIFSETLISSFLLWRPPSILLPVMLVMPLLLLLLIILSISFLSFFFLSILSFFLSILSFIFCSVYIFIAILPCSLLIFPVLLFLLLPTSQSFLPNESNKDPACILLMREDPVT